MTAVTLTGEEMGVSPTSDPIATIRARLSEIAEPGRPILSLVHRAAELTGIPPAVILSPSREAAACWVRFAVMLAASQSASRAMIGRALRRDHSSIIHGVKRAREIAQADPAFALLVAALAPA